MSDPSSPTRSLAPGLQPRRESADARRDVSQDATVAQAPTSAATPRASPSGQHAAPELEGDPSGPHRAGELATRYDRGALLGVGGMGEVRLFKDRRLGREVALKTLHGGTDAAPDAWRRFVREARVQGQLEHPSVVPVYDFATTEQGELYFTMRRVQGLTLEQILRGRAAGDAAMREQYSTRKLLTAFVSVCFALHYAHTRGVVHRDLKPGNIMLGDFGEVYLLDWGIAKLAGRALDEDESAGEVMPPPRMSAVPPEPRGEEPEPAKASASAPSTASQRGLRGSGARAAPITHDEGDDAQRTVDGSVIGTPAYMAPEQLRGRLDAIDARTDVYALGLILFELLVGKPFHADKSIAEILARTLGGQPVQPSRYADEVPPELDGVCLKATAREPDERYASARELATAVERYLDGDRDLERRRELAEQHVERAKELLGGAKRDEPGALRALMAALAIDTEHAVARRMLVQQMLASPDDAPPEAASVLQELPLRRRTEGLQAAFWGWMSWVGCIPLAYLLGVHDKRGFWGLVGLTVVGTAWAAYGRRLSNPPGWYSVGYFVLGGALVAGTSVWLGPFVLVPMLAISTAMLMVIYSLPRERPLIFALAPLTVLVPFALEWFGLVPRSFAFENGRIVLFPRAVRFEPGPTLAAMLYVFASAPLYASLILARIIKRFESSERKMSLQAWHLRQLAPEEKPRADAPKDKPAAREG